MNKTLIVSMIAIAVLGIYVPRVRADASSISDPSANRNQLVSVTDERPEILKAYLTAKGSPMADDADFFVSEADRLNLDWKLVVAIAGVESTFGQQIPKGSFNAWGWGVFTGASDGVHFQNWQDGITEVSQGLRYRYMDKGAKTVDEIGDIYAASPAWSFKVKWFVNDIEQFQAEIGNRLAVTI